MKVFKKIVWIIKRHPFLYYARFKLLSQNATIDEVENYSYNILNPKKVLPKYFYEINKEIFLGKSLSTDLEKVLTISKWLRKNIKGGSGLSLSSEKSLKKMLNDNGGVCSDITQVFNNFCVINDIKVKEWGITSFPYNGEFGGHAFNEFYSKELDKWILIDVAKTLMFYSNTSDTPLSVLELFENNNFGKHVRFESFLESNEVDNELINFYYLEKSRAPFLICNYNNKTYDHYLDRFQSYVPIFMIHFWLYIRKKSYYYMFPLNDCENDLAYDR